MSDMLGSATKRELLELYYRLKSNEGERKQPFALFVYGKGMLNGEQALEYLEKKIRS